MVAKELWGVTAMFPRRVRTNSEMDGCTTPSTAAEVDELGSSTAAKGLSAKVMLPAVWSTRTFSSPRRA